MRASKIRQTAAGRSESELSLAGFFSPLSAGNNVIERIKIQQLHCVRPAGGKLPCIDLPAIDVSIRSIGQPTDLGALTDFGHVRTDRRPWRSLKCLEINLSPEEEKNSNRGMRLLLQRTDRIPIFYAQK